MLDQQLSRVLVLKYFKRQHNAATVNDAIEGCGGPADGFRQEVLGLAKQGARKCIREGCTGVLVTTKEAVTPIACERRMSAHSRCQAQLFAVIKLARIFPINEACLTDCNGVCFSAHVAGALTGAEKLWVSDLGRR